MMTNLRKDQMQKTQVRMTQVLPTKMRTIQVRLKQVRATKMITIHDDHKFDDDNICEDHTGYES